MTLLYGVSLSAGTESKRTAGRLLAFSLWDAWGWREMPGIGRGEYGKPFFLERPGCHFNLSHTAGLCLCALSDSGPVGVDGERVQPRRMSLPRYVMSEREFAAFDGSWETFYEVWTLKEAYCKYLGRSIFPPREIPAPPPVPYRTYAGEGWRAALCGTVPLPEEIRWVDESQLREVY